MLETVMSGMQVEGRRDEKQYVFLLRLTGDRIPAIREHVDTAYELRLFSQEAKRVRVGASAQRPPVAAAAQGGLGAAFLAEAWLEGSAAGPVGDCPFSGWIIPAPPAPTFPATPRCAARRGRRCAR